MTASAARLFSLLGALALMLGVFALSSHALPPVPLNFPGLDKLVHATIYGVLAALMLRSMRHREGGYSRLQMAAAIALASVYGMTDEVHQYFVPGRTADVLDWCADTAGALAAVAISAAWVRRRLLKRMAPDAP